MPRRNVAERLGPDEGQPAARRRPILKLAIRRGACPICGTGFETTRSSRIYCSNAHRALAFYRRKAREVLR